MSEAAPNADVVIPQSEPADIKVTSATEQMQGEQAPWFEGFNDDLKGYIQKKGFKDPSVLADSYRSLEKLVGVPKDRVLKLPEQDDAPEWNDVYAKLGRPADPKEYKLESLGEEADFYQKAFHELGVSKKQAETLVQKVSEYEAQRAEETQQATAVKLEQQEHALKKEWGAAYEQNIKIARQAVNAFGVDTAIIDQLEGAMGYDGVLKFFNRIGSKIGESEFVSPQGSRTMGSAMTPEQARSEIQALKGDPGFIQKWSGGDRDSKERLDQLHRWAYPE